MSLPIRVLLLSDNKPGHMSNSMGVLKAMQKVAPVEHTLLHCRLRLKFLRYPLRWLLNRPHAAVPLVARVQRALIRFAYVLDAPHVIDGKHTFDWVLSAGGDTSFLNVWLAQLLKAKNAYSSSLRGLHPALFTLLFAYSDTVRGATHVITLPIIPTPIDRKAIMTQGREFRARHQLGEGVLWAVLIGGAGAGYRYTRHDMKQLVSELLALAQRNGAKLLMTTSRRTGLQHEHTLKALLAGHSTVAYACYYNQKPEKVVASFLGAADIVFCTADSGAMITEAITAGKPAYALAPVRRSKDASYQVILKKKIDAHFVKPVAISEVAALDPRADTQTFFRLLPRDSVTAIAEMIKPFFSTEVAHEQMDQ